MKNEINIFSAIFILLVVAIMFAFNLLKTIIAIILGIVAVATNQTKDSLVNDVAKEKVELDRAKDRAFRSSTALDHLEDLTIDMYRGHAKKIGKGGPTAKTYDHEILKIVRMVQTSFVKVADERGEHIPAPYLITINAIFLNLYESLGEAIFIDHLGYELSKYLHEGLRSEYQKDLGIL